MFFEQSIINIAVCNNREPLLVSTWYVIYQVMWCRRTANYLMLRCSSFFWFFFYNYNYFYMVVYELQSIFIFNLFSFQASKDRRETEVCKVCKTLFRSKFIWFWSVIIYLLSFWTCTLHASFTPAMKN